MDISCKEGNESCTCDIPSRVQADKIRINKSSYGHERAGTGVLHDNVRGTQHIYIYIYIRWILYHEIFKIRRKCGKCGT
jgi:hypothetical protein